MIDRFCAMHPLRNAADLKNEYKFIGGPVNGAAVPFLPGTAPARVYVKHGEHGLRLIWIGQREADDEVYTRHPSKQEYHIEVSPKKP